MSSFSLYLLSNNTYLHTDQKETTQQQSILEPASKNDGPDLSWVVREILGLCEGHIAGLNLLKNHGCVSEIFLL